MNQTKYNFFELIKYAVVSPMKYYKITRTSGARLTGFVFLFTFITNLFLVVPIFFYLFGPNGFTNFLGDDVPEFEFRSGEFHMMERYEMDDGRDYILVDTNVNKFNLDDIDTIYDEVILISKTNMVTYQYGRSQVISFQAFNGFNFDNNIFKLLKPVFFFIFVIMAIFFYLFSVGSYFFTSLIYSVVGLITSSATNAKLKFGTIYKIAAYGKVTSSILFVLLYLLMLVTPLTIPILLIMAITTIINCAYAVYGTLSHTTDAAHAESGTDQPPTNYFQM